MEKNLKKFLIQAVAIGAAIQGTIINNIKDEGLKKLVLLEITKKEKERREKELIKNMKKAKII